MAWSAAGSLARLRVGPARAPLRVRAVRLGSRRARSARTAAAAGAARAHPRATPAPASTWCACARAGARAVWPLAVAGLPPRGARAAARARSSCCRRSPGRAATSSTPTSTASPTRSTTSTPCPPSGRSRAAACRRASAREVAPLLRFLDRERLPYDLTTDLSLARARGPGARQRARRRRSRGTADLAAAPGARPPAGRGRGARAGGRVFGGESLRADGGARSASVLRNPSPPRPDDLFGERTSIFASDPPAPLRGESRRARAVRGVDSLFGEFSLFERSDRLPPDAELLTAAGREEGEPAFVGYRLGKGTVVRAGHAAVGAPARGARARRRGSPRHAADLGAAVRAPLSRRPSAILRPVMRVPPDRGAARRRCSRPARRGLQGAVRRGPAREARLRRPRSSSPPTRPKPQPPPKRKVIAEPWPTFGYDNAAHQGRRRTTTGRRTSRTWRVDARDTIEFPPSAGVRQRLHGAAEGPLLRAERQDRQAGLQDEELQALRGVVTHAGERHDLPVLHGLRGVRAGRPEPDRLRDRDGRQDRRQKWRYKGKPFESSPLLHDGDPLRGLVGRQRARDPGARPASGCGPTRPATG